VVTGGLGPTTDDLSAEAAAKAAGIELTLDEKALVNVASFFKKINRPMSESNRKQAFLPYGCKVLVNPVGTAPGFALMIGSCRFFFLPGVPYEMKRMFSDHVLPDIHSLKGDTQMVHRVRTITTFGLPESLAGEKMVGVEAAFPGIKLGLRANFPLIQIKFYSRDTESGRLEKRLEDAGRWAVQRLGTHVVSETGESMEAVVGRLLIDNAATLALAESCTGGLMANWLTNVAGSSGYFLFSGVTYANDAKMKVLGVQRETLEKYGAVHEETAREMAEGARRLSGATYGLSTSGIAGPDGGTPEKPVGTVCIGFADQDRSYGRRFTFRFGRRLMNKKIFAMAALDLLRKELLDARVP
jgi:nicotinamide-nucleotide amidase